MKCYSSFIFFLCYQIILTYQNFIINYHSLTVVIPSIWCTVVLSNITLRPGNLFQWKNLCRFRIIFYLIRLQKTRSSSWRGVQSKKKKKCAKFHIRVEIPYPPKIMWKNTTYFFIELKNFLCISGRIGLFYTLKKMWKFTCFPPPFNVKFFQIVLLWLPP